MKFNVLDLLLPRETKFYDYLEQLSDNVLNSCTTFHDLVTQIETLSGEELKKRLIAIKNYELDGDKIELIMIEELCQCFITPLDREDIHKLTVELDIPLNILKDLALKIDIYQIRKVPANVCRFAEIIVDIAKLQHEIVYYLRKKQTTRRKVEEMHVLENKGDELFHVSMAELFGHAETVLTVEMIKLKEIYELLEELVDSIDDIGKLIRGIKIKHG